MTIETHYNIGHEVWFWRGCTPRSIKIYDISTIGGIIKYYDIDCIPVYESECFPTKQSLLKSLE